VVDLNLQEIIEKSINTLSLVTKNLLSILCIGFLSMSEKCR